VTRFTVKQHEEFNHECNDNIPSTVFLESLITVAAALPANVIAVIGMDRLGRKFFLVVGTGKNIDKKFIVRFIYLLLLHFSLCRYLLSCNVFRIK
jgi:hypothetical protein